ncbi:MAG: hypothetical protein ACYS0I_17295, partial [Planctomycetota bacterium]
DNKPDDNWYRLFHTSHPLSPPSRGRVYPAHQMGGAVLNLLSHFSSIEHRDYSISAFIWITSLQFLQLTSREIGRYF